MAIARGIMQVGRINIYPTASSFVSISPLSDFANCGDTVTFVVKVENTKLPYTPVPNSLDGYVSVVDLVTGTVIGSGTLDGTGQATIASTLPIGVLSLAVKYDGYLNAFKASESSPHPFYCAYNSSETIITFPIVDGYYCPLQDSQVQSFTSLLGNPGIIPGGGTVEFALYLNGTTHVSLPSGTIDITGHATSYIPAGITGLLTNPADGYYLQATFDGYACFQTSGSPIGIAGSRVKPKYNNFTYIDTLVPTDGYCYSNPAIPVEVLVTTTTTTWPSIGTITLRDQASGTILATGSPTNGHFYTTINANLLPPPTPDNAGTRPASYTIRADYTDGYCYASSDNSMSTAPKTLHLNKYFTTLDMPITDAMFGVSHTLPFNCSDVITGTALNGLDGYFVFKLYEVVPPVGPDILLLTFSGQPVSVPAIGNPFTATGVIPANTMLPTSSYYVVGTYTPTGNLCYDTTVVTAQTAPFSPA